ncbi:hypothetical protein AB0L65_20770 [Nonomuraea sp. NPDC052116]|uniref:hypothetical protein n=1 Tax=Nonomuraea sp. NPDC052116 TaxID=3155665 RepID=UPI0034210CFB
MEETVNSAASGFPDPPGEEMPRVSDAAQETLEDAIKYVRIRILEEAERSQRGKSPSSSIKPADIEVALSRLAVERIASHERRHRISYLVWRALIVALVLLGLVLLSYVISSQVNAESRPEVVGAGFITGISLFILGTATGQWILRNRISITERRRHSSGELVLLVTNLEGAIRRLGQSMIGDNSATASLRLLLILLEREGVWTSRDVRCFRSLLMLRNSIVHGEDKFPTSSEMSQSKEEAKNLLRIIDDYEKSR